VIAVDTNLLIYARREEAPGHRKALELLRKLAEGQDPWAIPWPCIYEFLRVVTHPRVFDPPTRMEDALADLESLLRSPSLRMLGEGSAHQGHMSRTIRQGGVSGNLVHDAHIAALVVEHGVRELWTSDRDFTRFSGLRIRNPIEGL
jgi:uncharacterized protein